MTIPARAPKRSTHVLRSLAVAALIAAAMSFGAAPNPVRAATWTVTFEAAQHTGYVFDAAGAVVGAKTAALQKPSSAPATDRRWISGRGIYLRISAGIWAGYWIPESRLAYVPGSIGLSIFTPVRAVSFRAGTYEAYRFDAYGSMTDARATRLASASMAHADRSAVVNGRAYVRIVDGIWAGWWIPGSTWAPTTIACAPGAAPAFSTSAIVRSVPTATGRIALTFDMGGRVDPAVSIMRLLVLERVCATIFPTGEAASRTVGGEVLAIARAHPELFEVGNHTMHHCNLRDGGGEAGCPLTRPSDAFARQELTSADAAVYARLGRHTAPYWRPPYGAVDAQLVSVAGSIGYRRAVMWSIDTIDWKPVTQSGPTALGITSKIRASASSGAIVLMHLGGYNTRDSLPATLDALARTGLVPTTVSALYR